jgi:hypothetical protein
MKDEGEEKDEGEADLEHRSSNTRNKGLSAAGNDRFVENIRLTVKCLNTRPVL